MYKVDIYVNYKESILDPQVEALNKSFNRLGYSQIEDFRQGKHFELKLAKETEDIEALVEEICRKILVNEVMESYHYTISEEA